MAEILAPTTTAAVTTSPTTTNSSSTGPRPITPVIREEINQKFARVAPEKKLKFGGSYVEDAVFEVGKGYLLEKQVYLINFLFLYA